MLEALTDACASLPKPPEQRALEQMAAHWALVKQWNARTNLTAISSDEDAAWTHYRDSLEALPLLPPGPWVDLGSGAGYPGIPLAIASPETPVTLIEPRQKRVSFLETVAARLGLKNVTVVQGTSTRPPDRPYGAVLTRATFSSIADLEHALGWAGPGGALVAWRTEPTGRAGAEVHRYVIQGTARVLELWRKQ